MMIFSIVIFVKDAKINRTQKTQTTNIQKDEQVTATQNVNNASANNNFEQASNSSIPPKNEDAKGHYLMSQRGEIRPYIASQSDKFDGD
jgi:hypothetical protein